MESALKIFNLYIFQNRVFNVKQSELIQNVYKI